VKPLLQFAAATLLNGAFLYPLFYVGIGRPVSWWLVAAMTAGGCGCFYLLIKYRRQL